jgi:hypothetical protein
MKTPEQLSAELYDDSGSGWDDERIAYRHFCKNPLNESSSEMIWVARTP